MKIKFFLFTICVALLSLGAHAKIKDGKALTGTSLTDFGKYTIVYSDNPMVLNGTEVKTFDLTYENTQLQVRIGIIY